MPLTQWDIAEFDFPAPVGKHPIVIISPAERAERADFVNVLYCTSQRQSRPKKAGEVLLDTSDGLDWETFCRCDHFYSVPRAGLGKRRGSVSSRRRQAISEEIIKTYRLTPWS